VFGLDAEQNGVGSFLRQSKAFSISNSIEQVSFHVAILDLRMYPIDGVTLLAEIKKRSPSTQAIIVTAYPTVDMRDACMKYGAAGYLTKPIDIAELKDVIRHVMAAQDLMG
jgi:DNA-binding NtrC family response regulator